MAGTFSFLAFLGLILAVTTVFVFLGNESLNIPMRDRPRYLQFFLGILVFIVIGLVARDPGQIWLVPEMGLAVYLIVAASAGAWAGALITAPFPKRNVRAAFIAGTISGLCVFLFVNLFLYGQVPISPYKYGFPISDYEFTFFELLGLLPGAGVYFVFQKYGWLQSELDVAPVNNSTEPPLDEILSYASEGPQVERWGRLAFILKLIVGFALFFCALEAWMLVVDRVQVLVSCGHSIPFSMFGNQNIDVLLVTFCFLGSWLVARLTQDPFDLQGCGSRFYHRIPTLKGYITTKWLTICFVPVLPVRSYEIYSGGEVMLYSRDLGMGKYVARPLQYLYARQILRTGSLGCGVLLAFGLLLWLFMKTIC